MKQVLYLNYIIITIRGIIPLLFGSLVPCIVWVFPELVWPYAIIVPLNPSNMLFKIGPPTSLYISYCVESESNILSNMNISSSPLLGSFIVKYFSEIFLWIFYWLPMLYYSLLKGRNLQNTFIFADWIFGDYILKL